MTTARLRFPLPLQQVVEAGILLYSLAVMATVVPNIHAVPNTAVIIYFVLVPGYCISSVLRYTGTIVEGLFYSVAWSLALVLAVSALESLNPNQAQIPISVLVPAVAIIFLLYGHFHRGVDS